MRQEEALKLARDAATAHWPSLLWKGSYAGVKAAIDYEGAIYNMGVFWGEAPSGPYVCAHLDIDYETTLLEARGDTPDLACKDLKAKIDGLFELLRGTTL